jgi:hypothetical protein
MKIQLVLSCSGTEEMGHPVKPGGLIQKKRKGAGAYSM